jgi:hypothetical protein
VIVAGLAAPGEELDFFVAKYSSVTGQTMWMQHFVTLNPAAFETFGGMALDAAGNVYIAGGIQGNGTAVTYAPGHTAIGDLFHNIVALRLNGADGSVAWVKHWGGSAQDRAYGIAVSGSDVYIHGTTSSNPSTFDSHTLAGSVNMPYILRASAATGTVAQVRALQGSINAIAVNGNNVLLGGAVAGMFSIDGVCGGTPTASGSDGYLLMLTGSSLSCTWSRHFGSNTAGEDTFVRSVASFADGSWAVAGTFEGSISGLTSTSLSSAGAFDALAIRLAIDGTHQWSFRYGGTGSESVQSVATSTEGNVLLAGNFTGDITFGAHTVSGTNNVFVTRMSTAAVPTHEWAVSLGGAEGDSASDIAVAADGYVFASGTFSGMTTIGTTSLAAQQSDAWVAGLVR